MQGLHFITWQDQILSPNQWWKSIHCQSNNDIQRHVAIEEKFKSSHNWRWNAFIRHSCGDEIFLVITCLAMKNTSSLIMW